jgi:heme oxygenase
VRILAGVERKLCLTLGALAELETAFGVDSWEALAERLKKLSARDLTVVLAALLRGGGEAQAAEQLPQTPVDFRDAAEAIGAAFAAAGG